MGAGNFFAGLLGGYTGSLVKKQEQQFDLDLATAEMKIHGALGALQTAIASQNPKAIAAASQYFDESVSALPEVGKPKKKPKNASPHANLLQSIIGAIGGGGHGQPQSQQPSSLPEIPKLPGVTQGPGGMPHDAGIPAGAPAQASPIPPMPQRPVSLGDVYRSLPGPEQQAVTAGKSKAAEINALTEGVAKWEQDQGVAVSPQEKVSIQQHLAGIVPKLTAGRTLTGSFTAGTALPPGALGIDGQPIPPEGRTKDSAYGSYLEPDGSTRYFSIKPLSASASGQAIKVNSQNGIPTSITGHGQTFRINDPNMPAEFKPIAAQALRAHIQSIQEKATDEARRSKMLAERAIDTLFGLTPGESLYSSGKGGKTPPSKAITRSRSGSQANEAYLKTLNPKVASLVREIGTGKMPLERFGYILTRNPALASMVAEAYPDFDGSKVQSYISTVKDFTSGKTSIALNAGATALKHMQELMKLNTFDSRIPGSADSKAFHNKLDTVVGELVRFYQMPSTNQSYDSMKGTLGGVLNRDAAITSQINSMADKLASYAQQWKNAAPSSAYEAPMPHIDEKAKRALFSIDPDFASDYPDIAGIFSPKGIGGSSSNEIRVQIPGHPPGVIPKSALGAFKKQYPDAQVIQ